MSARVLVVDDDANALYGFAEALRRRLPGVRVDTALSPVRALVQLEHTQFDIVVTDFWMPSMNGLSLLRRVKAMQPHCAVFLMTGCDLGLREQASQLGARGFAEKPVVLEDFVLQLKQVLLERPSPAV